MTRGMLRIALLLGPALVAGCASRAGDPAKLDPAAFQTMDCPELNTAMRDASRALSTAAVTRGRIETTNVPLWVPGRNRAVSALRQRQSDRIEKLRQQEMLIDAARQRRCTRS